MKSPILNLESLEDRRTPAVWGNPWPEPERLTLSFAPDGTQVSGQTSRLFQELDSVLPRATWQREVLRAFQTWAQYGSINLSVLTDNGRAFGSLDLLQGGGTQGDIRLASVPLSHSELAVAAPFDLLGDWSGDVLLNTNYDFNLGGGTNLYDLFTVFLQESGHVFGLANSADLTSAMNTQYQGVRSGPNAADIVALQSLYGVRKPDRFDALRGNDTLATATPVKFISDADQLRDVDLAQASPPWVVHGDLTSAADVDFYRIQLPSGQNDFWVELRTSGLSLLTSRVTVLNSAFRTVQTTPATDPMQGDLAVFVSNATPGATYYIKVEKAQKDVFGIGSYHLAVGKEAHEALFPSTPSFLNDDRPDDDEDELGPLVPLPPRVNTVGAQWDYTYRASVSYAHDVDRYLVTAPTAPTGSSAMVVSVWGLETDKLEPKVTVYDTSAIPVPVATQVVRNDRGFYTVQVVGVAPGTPFEVRVEAADPQGSYKEGNYLVGVDFVSNAIILESFVGGTLTSAVKQRAHELRLTETRLFHLALSADTGGSSVEAAVRVTIYNAARQVVATLVAKAGETTSLNVLLAPGNYTVRFAAGTRNSSDTLPALTYGLKGLPRNDPIGPVPVPPSPTPPPPNPYQWFDIFQYPGWIVLEDPYGDPYSGL